MSGSRYGPDYLSHERWVSYVHQISALANIAPRSVLEVGVGPGVKATMVAATFPGCTYVGVDIDGTLAPDVRADVRSLPFDDRRFDAAFCCQVLEHIPYEDFLTGLGELKREDQASRADSTGENSSWFTSCVTMGHKSCMAFCIRAAGIMSLRVPTLGFAIAGPPRYP